MAPIEIFAQQEVRGITTRRVIYEGPEYKYSVPHYTNRGRSDINKPSIRWYGWEITNHNSITVSVDIELYKKGDDGNDGIVKTRSVILKSNETYIFKAEEFNSHHVDFYNSFYGISSESSPTYYISDYYIKYKAYKLE